MKSNEWKELADGMLLYTVIFTAAAGVFTLLRIRAEKKERREALISSSDAVLDAEADDAMPAPAEYKSRASCA